VESRIRPIAFLVLDSEMIGLGGTNLGFGIHTAGLICSYGQDKSVFVFFCDAGVQIMVRSISWESLLLLMHIRSPTDRGRWVRVLCLVSSR